MSLSPRTYTPPPPLPTSKVRVVRWSSGALSPSGVAPSPSLFSDSPPLRSFSAVLSPSPPHPSFSRSSSSRSPSHIARQARSRSPSSPRRLFNSDVLSASPSIRRKTVGRMADADHVSRMDVDSIAAEEDLNGVGRPVLRLFDQRPVCQVPTAGLDSFLAPTFSSSQPSLLLPVPPLSLPPSRAEAFPDQSLPLEVLRNLKEFRDQSLLCDVEIEVEGSVIPAHRAVLAAAIPYFRAMFSHDVVERDMRRICINDISYTAMKLLVDYVYSSEISINSENVQQLIFAASILQMDRVCVACQDFMKQYLTTSNCLLIRQFAEQHNCTNLMSSTDNFVVEHFPELRRLMEFRAIPFNHLLDLVMRSDLKVNSEEEVFETVMEWVREDPASRQRQLPDLLHHIRLSLLPLNYILNVVKQDPLIRDNRACVDIVSEAMFDMLREFNSGTVAIGTALRDDVGGSQYCAGSSLSSSLQSYRPEGFRKRSRPRKSMAGVIFCVGGRGTAGDPFRSVEAYDLRRDKWLSVAEMHAQRRHVGVVSAQGRLFAIGGHDGSQHLDTAECFDPLINRWNKVSSMRTARRGIAVGSLEGAIYAVGGLDDTTCFNTVERYDIESDRWSNVAPMNVQRGGVGVAALGKYLFAVGGNDGASSLDSCERYDPLLDKWKMVAQMTNRRAGAGVCVMDGHLYAIGGFDDNSPLATCERYDPVNDQWAQLAQMSCPRGGVGVAAMGGLVYAIGGHDGNRYLDSVETFDPLTNTWQVVAGIKECRAGAGVAWADCPLDSLLRPSHPLTDSGCAPNGSGVAYCV